jgi:hypothetical protein
VLALSFDKSSTSDPDQSPARNPPHPLNNTTAPQTPQQIVTMSEPIRNKKLESMTAP